MTTANLKDTLLDALNRETFARLAEINRASARLADTESLTEKLRALNIACAPVAYSDAGANGAYVQCWVQTTDDIALVLRGLRMGDVAVDRIIPHNTPYIALHLDGHDVALHIRASLAEAQALALSLGLTQPDSSSPAHLARQAA